SCGRFAIATNPRKTRSGASPLSPSGVGRLPQPRRPRCSMARHSPDKMTMASVPPAPARSRSTIGLLFRSLRPEQWTKNLVLFAGLLFGLRLFDPTAILRSLAGFGIFCMPPGVVYLVNDVMDREADKQHPLKCKRPIASGALAPRTAVIAALVIAGGSLTAAWFLGPMFFAIA